METGTVIARGGLNLRKSPGSGKVIKALRRSSTVEVLGEETWLRVRTSAGEEGFVLADFIELSPETLVGPTEPPPAPVPGEPEAPEAPAVSEFCDIRRFRHARFIGNELRADFDFFPLLDVLAGFAEECDVEIFVTSSTREPDRTVSGAIVPPASRSNHMVGHAIDMNLQSPNGFFNSKKLSSRSLPDQPREIRDFIAMVQAHPVLRWGGDFSREDPVHIDDNLNNRDPGLWDAKLASRR